MKKTSNVKSVQANGTWNSKDGKLFYKFEYLMDDGTLLTASHTTENHFKEGDEVEYEITKTSEYGNYGKVGKPNDFKQGFNKSKGGNGSFALSYAKDLVVADKIKLDDILKTADKFKAWLDGTN